MKTPDPKSKKNMTADDLFTADHVQVFSKLTGAWLGTVKKGQENTLQEPASAATEKERKDLNQLSIF